MRVCVIGLGAMGVAATRVLAERGHEVVGIDRHGVANDLGSSAHGQRIFRLAHDRPEYVRLARRALLHWRDLERRDGAALLRATGLLEVGGPHDEIVAALRAEHATVVELDGAEAPDLFPGPRAPARSAGALATGRRRASPPATACWCRPTWRRAPGPRSRPARTCSPSRRRPTARSSAAGCGASTSTSPCVAAGPWLNELLGPLGLEQPLESALGQASMFRGSGWDQRPCLVEWDRDGVEASYGMPVAGSGYKLGLNATNSWKPDDDERRPDHAESLVLSRRVTEGFVGLGPRPTRTERCPVTTTPDGGFLVDRRGAVVVAGGCSGHGFMFSPALGELIADLVEGSRSPERFRIDRPGLHPARLIS